MAIDPAQLKAQAQADAAKAYDTFTGVAGWVATHPKTTIFIGFAAIVVSAWIGHVL